jgi:MoaA/NifB/PqqE/SkfB family radical SAM enzyme
MKILCLGNNTEDTDTLTGALAARYDLANHGLVSQLEDDVSNLSLIFKKNGFYHTSIVDLSEKKISEALNYVDSIYVLDQPIESYQTTTEYFSTIRFGFSLGNRAKFLNDEVRVQFQYWNSLINTNSSFCIWPFIQMRKTPDGTTLCCDSSEVVTDNTNVQSFNGKEYTEIRKHLLNGDKINKFCSKCYDIEHDNNISPRIAQTLEWATRLNLKSTKDLHQFNTPISMEVKLDNLCNLKCRMCYPSDSSQIETEYKKIGLISKTEKYSQENELPDINIVKKLRKLYIAGGEPTINPKLFKFLTECIDSGNTNFLIQINTNAQKISDELLEISKKFPNMEFFVSVDGYKEANDYIRWGSKWQTIIENTHRLRDAGNTLSFTISLGLYGIFNFESLVNHLESEFSNSYIHGQYTYNIDPFILKHSDETIKKLENIKQSFNYNNNFFFKSFADDVIKKARESKLNKRKLKDFFTHNDILDNSRKSILSNYIPELEKQRHLIAEMI